MQCLTVKIRFLLLFVYLYRRYCVFLCRLSFSQPASTTTSHGSGSNIATAVAELNLCDIGLAADSGIAYGNIGTQRLHRSARYLLNLKTVLDATAFGCFARALPFTVQLKYYYFLFNFCVCKKATCCGAP